MVNQHSPGGCMWQTDMEQTFHIREDIYYSGEKENKQERIHCQISLKYTELKLSFSFTSWGL